MTPLSYRLPNGAIPVLLSSDIPDLVRAEAAGVLSYAVDHSEVSPQAISHMLFRTRLARRYRALAMVTNREELIDCLRAVVDGREHPSVLRTDTAATARRVAYVFPGQGSQRPGMGRLYYESAPAFRAEVDRCAHAFQAQLGESPLNYLLDEHLPAEDCAATVQPALFTQLAGLAAMWRSSGVAPTCTIGHSQGEVAAAYVCGTITLADAVRVVGIRARAADEFGYGDYAMAVVAADRDTCEGLLARCSGWAELSVVNSPSMTGISGDRETVQGVVDTLTERGTFARVIRVQYPAHTSLINQLGDKVRAAAQRELQNLEFTKTDIACLGSTLGGPITQDLPVDQYWFWNLRNTVRFDKAIAAALPLGVDTFVELAEHPTLQLAIQENLTVLHEGAGEDPESEDRERRATLVVGTSTRTAADLDEFTRNMARLAVNELNYSWECLGIAGDGPVPLPLLDFPNTRMNEARLWLPYEQSPVPRRRTPMATSAAEMAGLSHQPVAQNATPQLLAEEWVRLSQRSLVPPRAIGIVDHGGACAELAGALCAAAADSGATARLSRHESGSAGTGFNTLVILLPRSPEQDDAAAAAGVAAFFADRAWWPGLDDAVTDCWLVTVGGETVVADDPPPDLVHAAASAGFRSVGAKYLGVRFCHLDLPTGPTPSMPLEEAAGILQALHTRDESELALRDGGLYAKRIVHCNEPVVGDSAATTPGHVLIIGGTGKLGLEFACHYARAGARRITLVSRSGETAAVVDRLRRIRSETTTQILVEQCDVSDHAAVSLLAQQHRGEPADLIIHAAVQYSGVELEDITADKVEGVLGPKVVGIWRVLGAFPRTDECRVILCSSISATVGGRGVIIYAAANRMLDAMARRLRAEGLDCTSVQWGHWDVHPDLDGSAIAKLAGTGVLVMRPADALAVGMTTPFRSNVIVAAFELDRARSVLQTCGRGALLSMLSEPEVKPHAAVGPAGLRQRLIELVAGVIGVDGVENIDLEVPMVAIGLDSLQALELRRLVQLEFSRDLEVSDLLGGASISEILSTLGG